MWDEEKLQKENQRKRERDAKLFQMGLCYRCGKRPLRQSQSGRAKLCDVCHAKQVDRMRKRHKEMQERKRQVCNA